ncbi:AP-4 complex accessory subunit RUSC2 isoform X3 [Lepus europaeus]|uniref:AP-4 complex accessory subunit RUSC2 isoform X3 n=1 Tax=Lepus europaeus TaxID=9983 RepID=UPI002B45F290|nr:AP-4 complex accessory subunit RUSC2 isoform X3 [Lepus europaeus]
MPLFELSRMDSPPKLTGETLIVHHIPLVHCQVPDRQCCGGANGGSGSTRPNPFCPPDLGVTQPDQDLGQADSLLFNSLHSAAGGSARSTDSTKSRGRDGRGSGASKRHNPFLLQEGVGEPGLGDLYDDSFGDNATQQSFHLHSTGQPTFHLASFQLPPSGPRVGRSWGAPRSRAGVVDGQEQEPVAPLDTQQCRSSHRCRPELEAETMELDECGGPGGNGSGGGASDTSGFSFDHEWKLSSDESPRNPGCSGPGTQHCRCSSTSSQSEAADQSMGYVSDSSCNSSDGVLVTFSTLYNKMHSNSRANLNSAPQSCSDSSFCSHSDPGGFYLDLQPSPAESKMSCESHHPESGGREGGYGCPHASSPELDANCNSYRPHCEPCPAVADLTACFQSQARLVVATQNYYKLVTCDLSSQSSPSPAGSSITSCSEEHTKISPPPGPGPEPGPGQPSEYYLFQKPEVQPEEQEAEGSSAEAAAAMSPTILEGQVYTNTSPPNLSTGRQRSRSYDRSLERSPAVRLGSLERMLSCPVRLSEGPAALAGPSSPPRRVTSFAELAKGRKKAAGSGSPPLRVSVGDSSQEFSPIQEAQQDRAAPLEKGTHCSHSLPPMPLGPGIDLLGPEPWSTQVCQGPQSSETPPSGLRAAEQGPLAPLMDPGLAVPGSPANSHAQRDARARADANHLSPQALKWREYRRKNPLGPPGVSGSLDRRPQEVRLTRRNPIFEFPGSFPAAGHLNCRLNGQMLKPLPLTCPDFQDPFSLTEKPPAEFCLSPDGNSEAISIDLLQKKGLIKAVNTAVDLIVAHFGTSRDPGVKAKLGNSSVSPNVGHLVLKYLCPAVRAVLEDGLKSFVLDVIIGQRKNMPWSVVEASTQLGPSTKVLHGLYNKVSQFPELTSHTMRFNAFILGLLNIRSLEFWFNHLYNHEDIIQTHYQPWGFLSAAHTVCPGLFEELLLLLQPLALLPFSLDLLFQHRLLQSGQQQRQHKELLRVSQDLLLSAHSTLQLARARGQEGPGDMDRAAHGERVKGVGAPEGGEEEEEAEEVAEMAEGSGHGRWARSGQAGWWYQLMQSSQVYIDGSTEGSRFPRGSSNSSSEKKKVGGSGGPPQAPPPREGVVEGAEACPAPEEALGRERGWPFWMGSPPDSVLAELRRSREREAPSAPPAENEEGASEPSPGGIKWGHLFGSRKAQREARPTNRLPSDWLSLDKSMFQLVAQTVGARREPEPKDSVQEPHSPALPSKPPCEVQALCHHLATGPGQLSFHKGDILRVLGPAGGDWLRCSRGPDTGLVPLAYVTLTPTPSPTPGNSQN